MTGKFPACILNISISPSIVDVNVHPAKAEVRFSDEKIIFNAIYFAVKNAFMKNNMIYEFQFENKNSAKNVFTPERKQDTKKTDDTIANETISTFKNTEVTEKKEDIKQVPLIEKTFSTEEEKTEDDEIEVDNDKGLDLSLFSNDVLLEKIKNAKNIEIDEPKDEPKKEQYKCPAIEKLLELSQKRNSEKVNENTIPNSLDNQKKITVIGEVFCNYIMAEAEGSIVMIDKHAGHERIIYERLKSQDKKVESQLVINTGGILISENEFEALEENVEMLDNMGFKFDFSKKPFIIPKAIPIFLSNQNMDEIIQELAENIYLNKINPQTHCLDDMLHSIACKAAIKANDKNSIKELQSLAEQVYFDENIRHCPHGRPVMFVMTKKDIEKQFKRIQ